MWRRGSWAPKRPLTASWAELAEMGPQFELGTGAVVVDDIMALATAAADTVLSMAVLPVNEDDERVVENLMRRTRSTSTSSPL